MRSGSLVMSRLHALIAWSNVRWTFSSRCHSFFLSARRGVNQESANPSTLPQEARQMSQYKHHIGAVSSK